MEVIIYITMFIKVFCSDSDADQMINRSINQIWEKNEKIKTKAKVLGILL